MAERHPTPKRLAVWAIAGAFLAASTCLVGIVPIPQFPANGSGHWDVVWMNRLRLAALLGPLAIGVTISLLAVRRFKRSFHNNIWSEAELEPVKVLVTNPIWLWAGLTFVAPVLLSIIFTKDISHAGATGFMYLGLLPAQTAQRIRLLLTPTEKSASLFADGQNFKPIRSDHWGDPPLHPSE